MDAVSKAILETIGAAGYMVFVRADHISATDRESGERFIVRFTVDGLPAAVLELAQQVGIELEDG